MGCSTCGQRYTPPSGGRPMSRMIKQTPEVAPQPLQGDVVPNPSTPIPSDLDTGTPRSLRSPLGPIIPGKKSSIE